MKATWGGRTEQEEGHWCKIKSVRTNPPNLIFPALYWSEKFNMEEQLLSAATMELFLPAEPISEMLSPKMQLEAVRKVWLRSSAVESGLIAPQ